MISFSSSTFGDAAGGFSTSSCDEGIELVFKNFTILELIIVKYVCSNLSCCFVFLVFWIMDVGVIVDGVVFWSYRAKRCVSFLVVRWYVKKRSTSFIYCPFSARYINLLRRAGGIFFIHKVKISFAKILLSISSSISEDLRYTVILLTVSRNLWIPFSTSSIFLSLISCDT